MAIPSVLLSDTFDEWRVKTNTVATNFGDLTALNTTDKSSVVAAINEIFGNDSDDMEHLVDDATPQLGGHLDLNSKNVTGAGNINTTGTLTTSGVITAPSFSGVIEVSTDTTPQLGGNLDLNSKDITGTGNINFTGVLTATSIAGTVTGTTQSTSDNSTKLATTAYVDAQIVSAADGIDTLTELTDTTISGAANNHIIAYNSTTSKWENKTMAAAGGTSSGFAVAMSIALG